MHSWFCCCSPFGTALRLSLILRLPGSQSLYQQRSPGSSLEGYKTSTSFDILVPSPGALGMEFSEMIVVFDVCTPTVTNVPQFLIDLAYPRPLTGWVPYADYQVCDLALWLLSYVKHRVMHISS